MSQIFDLPHAMPEPAQIGHAVWQRLTRSITDTVRNAARRWIAWRTIRTLHSLSDRTLKDIGIDRSTIESCMYERMARDW